MLIPARIPNCCKNRLFEWFLNIVKVLLMRIKPYIFLFFKVSRKSAREEEMKVQRTLTWGRTQAFNFETFAVTLMQISTKAAFSNDFFLCRLVLRRVVHLVLENIMSKCIQVSFKNRLCSVLYLGTKCTKLGRSNLLFLFLGTIFHS